MKKNSIFLLLAMLSLFASGQTYNMTNGSVNTCSGTFYDSGGSGGTYGLNENFTMTFCAVSALSTLTFDFTAFRTNDAGDVLYVYDGPTIASPLIGSYTGNLGAFGTITSTGNCITFRFVSDGSGVRNGWAANISCNTPFPDDCATAIPLSVGSTCSYATFTNVGATGSTGVPAPTCANYVDDDIWFSVVVPACGHLVFDTDDDVITDGGMAIYSGNCGSLTQIECDDDDSPNGMMPRIDRTGLTPGSTVYIRVWEYGGDANGTFGICVYNPEPDCSGTPSPGATTANPSSGVCSGDPVLLSTSQTASCGLTYQWQSSPDNVTWSNIAGATGLTTTVNPTSTTWYRLRVTCSYSGLSGNSTPVQVVVATTTSTCANATVIGSIPYAASGLTTCCMGNDYTSSHACGSSYMDGEDYMFTITPSSNIVIDITLSGTLSYTGVFVTRRCPNAGGATCIAQATSSSGNPQLCGVALSSGVQYYIMVDTDPSPDCTPFNISITSSAAPTCNLNYSTSVITYGLENMTGATTLNITIDDTYAPAKTPIGFNFCYDGTAFSECLVSSNGYLIFDPVACATNQPSSNASPGGSSDYSIAAAVPNTADGPRNCIMFPWQDTDPNDGGTIRYKLFGAAPNRIFVLEYVNVRYFDDIDCPTQLHSAQVKLFETTNNIEIHIDQKDLCTNWNSGAAILGLHNYNGTLAVVPSGYNYPDQWTANNQAWRFSCNCLGCIILPVDFLEFIGENKGQANHLYWATASESNSDYFAVEKLQGQEYIEIGQVNAAGNSNQVMQYQFDDTDITSEISYYRLRQVDHEGDFTYSDIISVSTHAEQLARVFPNPAQNVIHVDFFKECGTVSYQLINPQGNIVSESVKSDIQGKSMDIEVNDLPSGFYLLIVRDASGIICQQKLTLY